MGAPLGSDTMTVAQWCDRWMKTYKGHLHGSNLESYCAQIQKIKARIGLLKMRDVYEYTLQEVLNELAGTSKSNISKFVMVTQQLFARAKANKIIRDDPALYLQIPQGTEGKHRALARWEADMILENWYHHRVGLWVMLMMLAGLRRGEIIALDWGCVDMENRTLTIYRAAEIIKNKSKIKDDTKTDAGKRILPICQPLYDVLNAVPIEKRTGLVCLSASGEQISQSAYDRGISGFNVAMERILNDEDLDQRGRRPKDKQKVNGKSAKKAKTKTAVPKTDHENASEPEKGNIIVPTRKEFTMRGHDLRYTFATALYDAGVDVKSAQYYLGHSDIKTTMNLYTELSQERENLARQMTITFLDSWLKKMPPVMPNDTLDPGEKTSENTPEKGAMSTKCQQSTKDGVIKIQENVVYADFRKDNTAI